MNRNRRRLTDAGASALEYAGLVVIAAILLGVLVPVLSGGQMTRAVQGAICRILAEQNCATVDGSGNPNGPGQDGDGPSRPKTAADYQKQLCDQLALDCANWDTSRGLSCNDARIQKVYAYYQHLFDGNSNLQWAGMAKLAGGTVYGGMQDLHVLRGMTKSQRLRWLASNVSGLPKPLADALADAAGNQFDFYENQLVTMQKQIFLDLGWQHAAYQEGGIGEMRRLASTGELTPQLESAWEDIDSGDPDRVKRGNTVLLRREQHDILQKYYDQMKAHQPLGEAVTYLIGLTAQSPVPGGKPFRDVVNEVHLPLGITLHAPLPTGNVATFNSRWKWITEDMLPKYQELLAKDPQSIKNEIDRPLADRAKQYRTVPNWLVPYNPKDGLC